MNKYLKLLLTLVLGLMLGFAGFFMDKLLDNSEPPEVSKAKAEAFLAENAKKDNIITTASGLQYEILKKGVGSTPTSKSRVTVHYLGTTIDGEEFDSSYSRGQPTTFPLAQVIPGWTEGIQLMNKGAKYRFFIPSQLAYGESGSGDIQPNATIIFEVELLKF